MLNAIKAKDIYKLSCTGLSSKIIRISKPEFGWVNNMLKIAKKNDYVKRSILSWNPDHGTYWNLAKLPEIDNDGHTGGTLTWTIALTQQVLKNEAKIRRSGKGYCYKLPLTACE